MLLECEVRMWKWERRRQELASLGKEKGKKQGKDMLTLIFWKDHPSHIVEAQLERARRGPSGKGFE